MSSNLKVNTILPSTGTTIGIGTVGGLINVVGNIDVNSTSGISTFNGLEISGIVTAKAGAAVTYYGDGSNLTGITGTTINNNADNRLITGSGTANTLEGEANLTYDGSALTILSSANQADGLLIHNTNNSQAHADAAVMISGGDNASAFLRLENNSQKFEIIKDANHNLLIEEDGTESLRIDSVGIMGLGVTPKSGQYSGYNHLQVGESATLSSNDTQSNTNVTNLTNNTYLNSNASAWKYLHADEASRYMQYNGQHHFSVAASGSADATVSFAQKLTIDTDGLKFNGDTSAANALDDYEEGSFTPTYTNTGGVTPNYNYQEGFYTKIGNLVTCAGIIGCTNANSFGSGKVIKIVLPFTCANNSYGLAGGGLADGSGFQNVFTSNQSAGVLIGGNTNTGRIVTLGSSPSNVYYTGSPGLQNSHYFRFRYIYHVS